MTAAKHAAPKRKAKPKTAEDKMEMIPRFLRSLRDTWTENPELLAYFPEFERILKEARQVAVANALEARRINPADIHAWSGAELGAVLGVTQQSMSEMAKRGRAVLAEEAQYENVSRFAKAYREKLIQAPTAARVEEIRQGRHAA